MPRRLVLGGRSFRASNAAALGVLAGCSALLRGAAPPPRDEPQVTVLGLGNIRHWGDEDSPALIAEGKAAYDRELAAWRNSGHKGSTSAGILSMSYVTPGSIRTGRK